MESITAELINNTIVFFGGPAVVIAIMSAISAYNHYRSRKIMENIEKLLEAKA